MITYDSMNARIQDSWRDLHYHHIKKVPDCQCAQCQAQQCVSSAVLVVHFVFSQLI